MWELLYANNLVIIAESEDEVVRRFDEWKSELETRGLKVNMDKIKMMVVRSKPAMRPQRSRYPRGVCGKEVRVNSVWCQGCSRSCHRRCSGLRNMNRAGDNYRCAACARGLMAIPWEVMVNGGMLDVVDSFCYLDDTMSCVGRVEAAVRARIASVWRKWRELVSLLVSQNIPWSTRLGFTVPV